MMTDSAHVSDPGASSAILAGVVPIAAVRHTATVRVTHWIAALCFLALLVSGIEIVISHPRFYWGEEGNVNTPALFSIPIPASRKPPSSPLSSASDARIAQTGASSAMMCACG